MVFCNSDNMNIRMTGREGHNPYFNRWFSAIYLTLLRIIEVIKVTILILIDGFLQFNQSVWSEEEKESHNPYFNRWFSAIN